MKTRTPASDVDPLDAIRTELVAAARRRTGRARRHRRTLVATVVSLSLASAGALAATLAEFTTGVPAIDRLLENSVVPDQGQPSADLRPGPGDASEPLPLPAGEGGKDAVGVAYLSRDGRVCAVQGELRRFDNAPRGSYGGCYEPESLAAELARKGAILQGSTIGPERRIYDGFAAADVHEVRLFVNDRQVARAELTDPWTPAIAGAEPLRFWVAIDETDIDVGDDGVQQDEIDLLPTAPPDLEVEFSDGRVIERETP